MDGIREKFISSAAKLGIGDALSGADAIVCAISGFNLKSRMNLENISWCKVEPCAMMPSYEVWRS